MQNDLIVKSSSDVHTGEIDASGIKTRGKRNEQLTERDLRELMGENRQTYKRAKGAIRRR